MNPRASMDEMVNVTSSIIVLVNDYNAHNSMAPQTMETIRMHHISCVYEFLRRCLICSLMNTICLGWAKHEMTISGILV